MAMRNPNRLRLVDCDLPDDVERQLAAFEDDFDAAIQPFFDRLDALTASDLAGILAALEEGIALRDELLQGAPVRSLGSLEAIEDSLNLTNPQRTDEPETIRIDERKVGAAGIALINGRMFRILSGTRVDGFRALWFSVGGDYDAFILAASTIFGLQAGSFAFYQSNPQEAKFPLVNKSFDRIFELTGYGTSVFIHNLFWNGSIATTTSNRLKLNACGFSEDQIVNIFSGQTVNADFDFSAAMTTITDYIRDLASVVFKPIDDPLRLPAWQLENTLISLILDQYFEYRTKKYTNSYILDQSYFSLLITNLRKEDLKELFEQRPELHDIELPPDPDGITALVSNAVTLQAGTLLNTYMNSLPEPGLVPETQLEFECRLFNMGFVLWKYFLLQYTEGAAPLELRLRELQRKKVPLSPTTTTFCGELSYLNPEDYSSVLGTVTNNVTSGLPPVGTTADKFMEAMRGQSGNDIPLEDPNANGLSSSGILIQTAVSAVDGGEKQGRTEEADTAGSESGLPTKETLAQLLARRIRWSDNFINCTADANLSRAAGQSTETKIVDMNTGLIFGERPVPDNPTPAEAAQYAAEVSINKTGIQDLKKAEDEAAKAATDAAYKAGLRTPLGAATALGRATAKRVLDKAAEIERERLAIPTAVQRNQVVRQEGRPYNSFSGSFVLNECNPLVTQKIGQFLEKNRKKLQAWLVRIITVIQELIVYMQDKIDSFLLKAQQVLDVVLSKLEKILSVDVNLSGKLGFENSLIKCAWGVDFGIKLDLMGLILQYLGSVFATIGLPLRKFLELIQDFLNEVFCIPIRMFEAILGATSSLIGKVGCTIKDFRLPVEISQLLRLITGTFELRGLVLRAGVSDWFDMITQLRTQQNEFSTLSQFSSVCQSPSLGATVDALSNLSLSNGPITVLNDILGRGLGLRTIGATIPL